MVGPWEHQENVDSPTVQVIRLKWFDTWLKGARTGMADTGTPLHLFENGGNQWVDLAAWPPSPGTFRFGGGPGALTYRSAPLAHAGVLDGPSDVTVYAR